MYKRLMVLAALASHGTLSPAQSEETSLFWRSCKLTNDYKRMANDMAELSESVNQCRTERNVAQEELGRTRAELELVRREKTAAVALGESNLKNALRGAAIRARYIKSSRAAECPAAVVATFQASSAITSLSAQSWGATGQSATCGATAWCSSANDKDGDPYLIISVSCIDNRANTLVDELGTAADKLR